MPKHAVPLQTRPVWFHMQFFIFDDCHMAQQPHCTRLMPSLVISWLVCRLYPMHCITRVKDILCASILASAWSLPCDCERTAGLWQHPGLVWLPDCTSQGLLCAPLLVHVSNRPPAAISKVAHVGWSSKCQSDASSHNTGLNILNGIHRCLCRQHSHRGAIFRHKSTKEPIVL